MNPELLPQKPLNAVEELIRLAPPETSTREHIEATMDYLEARMDRWTAEQNRRLLKAEKRIRLCAFLQGMLYSSGLPLEGDLIQRKHFSWCPYEAWMSNSLLGYSDLFGPAHSH